MLLEVEAAVDMDLYFLAEAAEAEVVALAAYLLCY